MKRLLIAILTVMTLFGLTSCGSQSEEPSPVPSEEASVEQNAGPILFYESETVRASFVSVDKAIGMEMGTISVIFENLTDSEITVLPSKSSVNDTMVQFVGGVPATMQGGKKLNYAWGFFFEKAGISDINEVKSFEVRLIVTDEHLSTIEESEILTVKVSE